MPRPRCPPSYLNRSQRFWLVLSMALGLGSYFGLNHVLGEPSVAALLTVCALVLLWFFIGLSRRLHQTQAQRDQALVWANSMQAEISGLKSREQELQEQAHHDSLTGLANRLLLTERFRSAVARAKRSGLSFAILMIDLNDFKAINDNHGHAAGDTVLVAIAKRLVGAVRACDTVARLGGDEFVLIIEAIDNPQELDSIGEKLFDTLADAVTLDSGVQLTVGASVGLAMYPDDGSDFNTLLNVADHAMYQCKTSALMALR